MLKTFKENKKAMEIKMEQASKLADAASEEFIESIKSLVKDASVEDVEKMLSTNDEDVSEVDKLAIAAMFAQERGVGIMVIGIGK